MDLSAVIFVLLAVAWAGYLIPRALRHHDETARTRSIDTFSGSTRVLARSEPADDRDTRLVVTPARPVEPSRPVSPDRPVEPVGTSRRLSVRAAARRRRRILALLLVCVVGTAVVAGLSYLPWWSVAVPGGLTLAFLVLCRTLVRREARTVPVRSTATEPEPASDAASDPAPATPAEPAAEVVDEGFDDVDVLDEPLEEPDGAGTIWDPLPVTLPTYVTAPKAHRTVRTIDLGEPGTWTSGRTAEDAEIAVQAAQPQAPDGNGRRAVGT